VVSVIQAGLASGGGWARLTLAVSAERFVCRAYPSLCGMSGYLPGRLVNRLVDATRHQGPLTPLEKERGRSLSQCRYRAAKVALAAALAALRASAGDAPCSTRALFAARCLGQSVCITGAARGIGA
jgi:hypothetical protein